MKRKSILIGIVILAGVAGALGFFWPFGNGPARMELHGVVEVQEVRLGSKIGGRVEEVMVREGERIQPGQELVRFEAPELKAQQAQWQAKLQSAEADLQRLQASIPRELEVAAAQVTAARAKSDRVENGWREEEQKKAEADWKTAEADLQNALREFSRVASTYQRSVTPRADYDAALARREQAQGRRDAAWQMYRMMEKGSRPEDKLAARAEWQQAEANYQQLYETQHERKALAQAQVAEIQAKLQEVQVNLDEAVVRAPSPATVEVVAIRKGDLVPPNQPILRILRTDDLWVKAFVPETQLGKVRLGQQVEVYIDTYPDRPFHGEVFYRGNISEFTPRNVQSVDERRYQVFPIKIRVDDPDGVFNSGMAARVVVPSPEKE